MKSTKVKNSLVKIALDKGLGERFQGDKTLLMLAGAAIGASIEGKENAKLLNMDRVFVKDGFLVRDSPSGKIETIKEIKRSKRAQLPKEFRI